MRQVRWPTEGPAEVDPIDDRCLPGRFQRRLAFAPLPRGLQLHFPFEPSPAAGLDDDRDQPVVLEHSGPSSRPPTTA